MVFDPIAAAAVDEEEWQEIEVEASFQVQEKRSHDLEIELDEEMGRLEKEVNHEASVDVVVAVVGTSVEQPDFDNFEPSQKLIGFDGFVHSSFLEMDPDPTF